MTAPGIVIGVDASRNRSGGAVAHLNGLMSGRDPREFGISRVHLWAHDRLLEQIAAQPWLAKHEVPETRLGLGRQLWWQYAKLPRLLAEHDCSVVFNSDAGSVCPARNSVTLSQDMLSFEPGEMRRYGLTRSRLRLEVLRFVQARRLKQSRLAIYLTEYARRTIEGQIGPAARSVVIPHGIDDKFRAVASERRDWPADGPVRCLYVSNAAPYKHQWHVVEAIALLRKRGYPLELSLVGGGSGGAQLRLAEAIDRVDPKRTFVSQRSFVPNDEIPRHLAASDLFIFASSCENLPITMLEAMASGIPICSSNRGPMPEVLGEEACCFDPESPTSVADAVQSMLDDPDERRSRAARSLERSKEFTWARCSSETWKALVMACEREDDGRARKSRMWRSPDDASQLATSPSFDVCQKQ